MVAPTASADGYGCSAESLVLAATQDHGADINFIEHDWRDSRFSDKEFLKLRVGRDRVAERDVLVVYFLPFALAQFRSRITIGMSMWETDRLPPRWAACCQLADAWLVPCEHSRDLWSRYHGLVEVVPFGTDTNLYSYLERASDKGVCFLMSGLLHYRKGVDLALRAFREEFRPNESARMLLKTRKGFLDVGSETAMLDDPRVLIIDEDYTREQMVHLYHLADCLLAPSRGEGSGLTPRDAMATGLPVILTDWSGLSEIADERYNYPISIDGLGPAPTECSSYQHGVTGGGPIGNFAQPSISALRQAMRQVYEDRSEALRRGREAADWMRREYTWEHCAHRWLRVLEQMTMGAMT